jgi:predicted transposase YbfD/YdcC
MQRQGYLKVLKEETKEPFFARMRKSHNLKKRGMTQMNYITLEKAMEQIQWDQQIDALSIYRAFEQVEDQRKKRGVRYSIALILTLVVLGKLTGMTNLQAMSEWVRLQAGWLSVVLPCTRKSFPCAATYSNVLRAVEASQVNEILTHLLARLHATRRCGEEPSRLVGQAEREQHQHVALDGKTLRGTLGHQAPDQKAIHQLALYETQTGLVLKEAVVGEKQNELSIVSPLLTEVWVKGRIITADALHTQTNFCLTVTRWKGDYILVVKDNQPTLAEDLRLFFEAPPFDCHDWRSTTSQNKGHGRLERRPLTATTDLNAFLAGKWIGVAQVFRLIRRVQEQGETRETVTYGFTSLSPLQADADRLLELIRAHWAIENRLHYRRDVTLREDHSQVRKGNAPRVLAVLNSFLLALMDFLQVSNLPQRMRLFVTQPLLAVRLLLGSLLTFK